jgi:hypothetical protein
LEEVPVIGVVSKDCEVNVVREFFELFKTPWEFVTPRRYYDVVIVTSDEIPADLNTNLLAIYNSKSTQFDDGNVIATRSEQGHHWLECDGVEFPVYGDVSIFQPAGRPFMHSKGKSDVVGLEVHGPVQRTVRIGYDLFKEISLLLSRGQSPENAYIPTLEIHISLLRSCMLNAGISFMEIPPVPADYDFMACLTHDVDFVGIRRHKCDHTMFGFLLRALPGSLVAGLTGRMPWSRVARNWKAAFSLPLVYLGLLDDFWLEFDRYMKIERDFGSTFFFIPFKGNAGTRDSGPAPERRAAKYDVTEIKEEVHALVKHGCEVGLHGIDAWSNSQQARAELRRISEITGQSEIGVRMHWLYFSENSPRALEEAGFSYDSTFGYNDAVGFRAGTTQAFCPARAQTLLELPLNIQDTALFYPGRMNLSETQALDSCKQLIQFLSIFGGTLTVNWHGRSLSPERLWGDFYARLLEEIQSYHVWFGTAKEIVTWYRKRRALRFDLVQFADNSSCVRVTGPDPDGRPSFVVRVHHPRSRSSTVSSLSARVPTYSDTPWNGKTELMIAP